MRKSRFLAFLLSFIPGCGFMYLGYMKRGLQYMIMFGLSIVLSMLFMDIYLVAIISFFIVLAVIIWIYQLFDTLNTLSRMKRMNIEFPEDDGFFNIQNFDLNKVFKNRKFQKALAIVLIVIGVNLFIFNSLFDIINQIGGARIDYNIVYNVRDLIFPILVSAALIFGGIKLLMGSKNASRPKRKSGELLITDENKGGDV